MIVLNLIVSFFVFSITISTRVKWKIETILKRDVNYKSNRNQYELYKDLPISQIIPWRERILIALFIINCCILVTYTTSTLDQITAMIGISSGFLLLSRRKLSIASFLFSLYVIACAFFFTPKAQNELLICSIPLMLISIFIYFSPENQRGELSVETE